MPIDPKQFKIGDVIHYTKPDGYPGFFTAGRIAGETSRSWLIMDIVPDWRDDDVERWAVKIPKHAKGYLFGTPEEAELARWASNHRYKIARTIEYNITPVRPEVLKQIAELIGYKPEEA